MKKIALTLLSGWTLALAAAAFAPQIAAASCPDDKKKPSAFCPDDKKKPSAFCPDDKKKPSEFCPDDKKKPS